MDVFGPPAASQLSFKNKGHHSTVCGGIFGIGLILLSGWFFALECRNLGAADVYSSSQIMYGMPVDTIHTIPSTDSIMAYRNSKPTDEMIGMYWNVNKNTNTYTPHPSVDCSALYSSNPSIS